jgi:hypothetical protein
LGLLKAYEQGDKVIAHQLGAQESTTKPQVQASTTGESIKKTARNPLITARNPIKNSRRIHNNKQENPQ